MYGLRIAVFGLLVASTSMAQQRKIPVSVSRTGEDKVGTLFVSALNRELSRSTTYQPMSRQGIDKGLRFYIELATIAVDDGHDKSAVSVVVEDMGLPSSFPVATKWYHKVVLVGPKTAETFAQACSRHRRTLVQPHQEFRWQLPKRKTPAHLSVIGRGVVWR
jgi:hypothetical protein